MGRAAGTGAPAPFGRGELRFAHQFISIVQSPIVRGEERREQIMRSCFCARIKGAGKGKDHLRFRGSTIRASRKAPMLRGYSLAVAAVAGLAIPAKAQNCTRDGLKGVVANYFKVVESRMPAANRRCFVRGCREEDPLPA
jgi:hypothetical protein